MSNDDSKKGGIAWVNGSLVGSQNPNAPTGYRYSTASKRYRIVEDNKNDIELPTNIQVQFQNRQGEQLDAGIIDLPVNSTVDDLTALIHQLLNNNDDNDTKKVPYSFYAAIGDKDKEDAEIHTSIADIIKEYKVSTENVLQLTYQPLAIFRVRPVSRCTDTLQGHTEAVLHVSYSPNGKLLASGGGDTVVRFWDVYTSTTKYTCKEHKDHVLCTSWSSDGLRFASADKRGVLIIWDPATGKSIGKHIQAHNKWITSLAWEPLHNCKGTCVERIATSSRDCTIKLWNTRTGTAIKTLSGHTDSVESIKWNGENLLYSASRDRTIKVWNIDRGILVRTLIGHGHRVNTLALSCDAVLRVGPYDYKNISFQSNVHMKTVAIEKYNTYRKEHGEDKLVSGSDDYTLYIWNPESSKHPIKRLTGHQQIVNHIMYSPDGRYFASASFDKKIKLWDGYTGNFICTMTGHVNPVYQLSWSADSRYVVSASKDSTAKLWEIPSGKHAKQTLPGHADEVYTIDWSPISGSVATGSKDRTIKIWKH